jgi:hypothetical protein
MISEECVKQFRNEIENNALVYEYTYTCITVLVYLVQFYFIVDYAMFRMNYRNQYEIAENLNRRLEKIIVSTVPFSRIEKQVDYLTRAVHEQKIYFSDEIGDIKKQMGPRNRRIILSDTESDPESELE